MATGSFRLFWDLFDTIAGVTRSVFGRFDAVKDTTLPDGVRIDRIVTLPARTGGTALAPVKLFDYTEALDFELLMVQVCPGDDGTREGLCWLSVTADTFTDDEPDDAGNKACVAFLPLSCTAPFILNSDSAAINATAADRAGLTAGVPTLYSDAGTDTETGKVVAVYAANDSATVDMQVLVIVRG